MELVISDYDKHYKVTSTRTKTEPPSAVNNRSVRKAGLVPEASND